MKFYPYSKGLVVKADLLPTTVMNYISNSDTSLLTSGCKALSFLQVKIKQDKIFAKANILKPVPIKTQNISTNQLQLHKCVRPAARTLSRHPLPILSLAIATKNLIELI